MDCRPVYDLFTDGSCILPQTPQLRLAAWGVTLARQSSLAPVQPLCSGRDSSKPAFVRRSTPCWQLPVLLPSEGYRLGFGRTALGFLVVFGGFLRVRGGARLVLQTETSGIGSCLPSMTAWPSDHSQGGLAQASDALEDWALLNNGDVDQLAGDANLCRHPDFRNVWEEVRRDFAYQGMVAKATVQIHAAVALAVVRLGRVPGLECHDPFLPTAADEVVFPPAPDTHVPRLWARYGRPHVEALYSWLDGLAAAVADHAEPLRWVSVLHLLFMFFKSTGMVPPWFDKDRKRWVGLQDHRRPDIARPHVGTLSAAFCRHLREAIQSQGGAWISVDQRPLSSALQVKVRTIACRVPDGHLAEAERVLMEALPGGVCGGRSTAWKGLSLR